MNVNKIPNHLKQYIVDQEYNRYTIIDHKVWSFIMDISIPFFKKYAHSSYYEGLNKTGITLDKIPSIENMNEKMSLIGWGVVPVRGFIPPWAFMEFQALGILPIACDMRNSEHLTYTPAPDIVHESAGHSPIIINEEYSYYLKRYGKIASKAIFSEKDKRIYYAIRKLSDLKENRNASQKQILDATNELNSAKEEQSTPSEATLLSRLHWWTVEYGLVGELNDPKIYGAGLLSSVGESQNCLKDNVKKIPLTIDCINYNYDITEQQPQLFVVKSFSDLSVILNEFEKTMAFNNINSIEDVNKTLDVPEKESKISELNKIQENNPNDKNLIELYQKFYNQEIEPKKLLEILDVSYRDEWLLRFEIYKNNHQIKEEWVLNLNKYLNSYKESNIDLNNAIKRGLNTI
jgi:phenylalanine-4-hydroxylase